MGEKSAKRSVLSRTRATPWFQPCREQFFWYEKSDYWCCKKWIKEALLNVFDMVLVHKRVVICPQSARSIERQKHRKPHQKLLEVYPPLDANRCHVFPWISESTVSLSKLLLTHCWYGCARCCRMKAYSRFLINFVESQWAVKQRSCDVSQELGIAFYCVTLQTLVSRHKYKKLTARSRRWVCHLL